MGELENAIKTGVEGAYDSKSDDLQSRIYNAVKQALSEISISTTCEIDPELLGAAKLYKRLQSFEWYKMLWLYVKNDTFRIDCLNCALGMEYFGGYAKYAVVHAAVFPTDPTQPHKAYLRYKHDNIHATRIDLTRLNWPHICWCRHWWDEFTVVANNCEVYVGLLIFPLSDIKMAFWSRQTGYRFDGRLDTHDEFVTSEGNEVIVGETDLYDIYSVSCLGWVRQVVMTDTSVGATEAVEISTDGSTWERVYEETHTSNMSNPRGTCKIFSEAKSMRYIRFVINSKSPDNTLTYRLHEVIPLKT